MMDIAAPAELVAAVRIDVVRLRVERASVEELAAHHAMLATIAQESRKATVWIEVAAA